jgi:hypothetical protein
MFKNLRTLATLLPGSLDALPVIANEPRIPSNATPIRSKKLEKI